MHQRKYSLLLLLFIFSACNNSKRIEPGHLSKSDSDLYSIVEKQTFQYFWEGAEPNSGMARERFHVDDIYPGNDKNVVTTGGSGFGFMAILAGINEHFISTMITVGCM